MTLMESYMVQQRRANVRLWFGYLLANIACVSMLALVWYW